ncbi:hypothetical protein BAE44_0011178 [Dichanthelium oligosanthes]|uniref:F-box domain-containing protein n=1 Tax=Dichanthelium oligosanthes TaxID=888268 RepID=A0A1E5VRV1_9POAL|nr:hypothetical protein BAE44_0011178 [Dichanthelium oligosanthes]
MASSSSAPPPTSGWAGLPRDVLWFVFTELGQREVLSGGAGLACVAWRHIACYEPAFWRRIDLTSPDDDDTVEDEDYDVELSDDYDCRELSDYDDNMFSVFDDDDYPIYNERTPAKDDDEDLTDIFFALFDDDPPIVLEKTCAKECDDESLFGGLFDDPPIYQEKIPATVEDDDEDLSDESLFDEDKEKTPPMDDETVEDDGVDLVHESLLALLDDTVEDNDEVDLSDNDDKDDDTVGDDDDDDLSDDCLFDDPPICPEKIPANDSSGWKAMALAAIDRSAGQCEAFSGRADDEVLLYLADRAPSMKSLRVTSHYDVSSEIFTKVIKKFPLLQELELVLNSNATNYTTNSEQTSTNSWVELFQAACQTCSHLRHFTVRRASKKHCPYSSYDQRGGRSPILFSIPMMHGLHSLELFGDTFPRDVVMKIVDNCPSLKSLNISDVLLKQWDVTVLRNKCSRIKDLRLPAVHDYDSDESYSDCS